ncbi:MAG TPA: alpha/beta fold hydrolase [Streptosporangiaceae bacterium]|jgi:pimeloyl-ACP methyl ester carboxylesterase|nr:alpha/beta fold hydrolase [Streptosporangiaceae bacterium]
MTAQTTQQHVVAAPGGRVLAVEEAGHPDGLAVLVHNGTPNSRHLYGPHVADATARGLRLIGYDRPGYGGSSPQPGRTVADCAADVRAICDGLGITRLATWGISGGGPHLLATAALLPDLVVAAASLASPAPFGAEGLDWFAGMGQENVDDFKLAASDDLERVRERCEEQRTETMGATAATLAAQMPSLLTPTDAAVFTGELAEYLVYSEQDGFSPGAEGLLADSLALTRGWTFELGDISVPMLLMHGREDKFVPFGHGQWLAGHIPGVDARLLDHDGHLTLAENRIGEVHAWLAAHA